MNAAWHSVASVTMSTIPRSTRSRSREDETVLMTAYSVSFSRSAPRSAASRSVRASTGFVLMRLVLRPRLMPDELASPARARRRRILFPTARVYGPYCQAVKSMYESLLRGNARSERLAALELVTFRAECPQALEAEKRERSEDDRSSHRPGDHSRGSRERRIPDARQRHPRRAVLLLHRRADVADPRRLHDVRDGGRKAQERARHGDEEHPHDRRRDAELLLLRLVDLQLQPERVPADRAQQLRLHECRLPGRHPVVRHLRTELHQQHQPRLLPGVPALQLDDRLDHVGRPARACSPLGVPRPGRAV